MAPRPSKPFARDIIALSDAELDQYIHDNDGRIAVRDSDNLINDEAFMLRLRARSGPGDAVQSRPLDLGYLTSRLEEVAEKTRRAPRYSPSSSLRSTNAPTEPLEEKSYPHLLEEQTKYCNRLLSEGGRPSHPVSLGRDILEDAGDYHGILSYWQNGTYTWEVFKVQLQRWRCFRKWQRDNRENGRFCRYAKGIQQTLAKEHDFRRPFQLCEDPEQQDQLSTWIEYLDYEYWWFDKDIRFVQRKQPIYDQAWTELVASQVLRPNETERFMCNIESAFEHAGEAEQARVAVLIAEAAFTALPLDSRRRFAAQSKLDAALRSLNLLKRRHDIISEFHDKVTVPKIVNGWLTTTYVQARDAAERRSILIRWIIEQVPLIELELENKDTTRGRSVGKHRRYEDASDEEPPSKRSKLDVEQPPFTIARPSDPAAPRLGCRRSGAKRGHRKRTVRSSTMNAALSKRLSPYTSTILPDGVRRSARIAQRGSPPHPKPRGRGG